MRRLGILTMIAMAFAFCLPAASPAALIKKADNFIIFLDQSGSMKETHPAVDEIKIERAVSDIARFDKAVPDLDYRAGMYLFAKYAAVSKPASFEPGDIAGAASAVDTGYYMFGRETPMGDGLAAIGPVIGGLSGKTALVLFTDGDSNLGSDPVVQAEALYDNYSPNLCIHVVSYANNARGQKIIDEIRALNGCTVAADVESVASDAAMGQFAYDVLVAGKAPEPAPAPPPPPPAPVAKEVITFNLLFGFDEYQITDEMVPILEQAMLILEEDPEASFTVAGHTDSVGTEEYNQGLSERRAASVKNWLTENGIAASRLDAVGYGETRPKYDNSTDEGRRLNRRVEIVTQ